MLFYKTKFYQDIRDVKENNIRRVGVIPYFFTPENKVKFILSKNETDFYSDLGGCKIPSETLFECAKRELYEESLGLFNISPFSNLPCLVKTTKDINTCICFFKINVKSEEDILDQFTISKINAFQSDKYTKQLFLKGNHNKKVKYRRSSYLETYSIHFFEEEEFLYIMNNSSKIFNLIPSTLKSKFEKKVLKYIKNDKLIYKW